MTIVIRGVNDLAFKNPDAAREWHPTMNGDLTPGEVIAGSNKKFWWQCEKGHSWEATPNSRSKRSKGGGCGVCSGLIILTGFNDLATRHPKMVERWHPTKNGDVRPNEIGVWGRAKFWWQCEKNHEWESIASSQVISKANGCPVCSGKKVVSGINDIQTSHPKLVKEWHPVLNLPTLVTEITRGSRRKVWWRCGSGHEWQAQVANRTSLGHGCPYCNGQKVLPGENDLKSLAPELAAEWHPDRNLPVTPDQVFASSGKRYWWLCSQGHEWNAQVASRNNGNGCPYCANQRVLSGYNDLGTDNPSLSLEWHPSKNDNLTPAAVIAKSTRKVWWLGKCGHEWQSEIFNRNSRGTGCPYCSNQRVLPGYNDLITTHRELASEWHPTKNASVKPDGITAGSQSKFWWLGKCGHEWQAVLSNRSIHQNGCPYCSNQLFLAGFNDLATVGSVLLSELHPVKNGALDPGKVLGSSTTRYWWLCSEGHEWLASSAHRLRGTGCPKCAKTGYDQTSPGYLYLLRMENLGLQQFGITNAPEKRLSIHKRSGWVVLDAMGPADGLWVLQTETALKKFFRARGLLLSKDYEDKFDGYSESWDSSELQFKTVAEMLSALTDFEWSGETL